jgi:hypothetical protein
MGKHSRPGPPNQPSRAIPRVDAGDPLTPYNKRRRPPMDQYRRHRPASGGGGHLQPGEARILEEWDGFTYQVVGTALDLAAAQEWVNALRIGDDPAE